MRFRQQKQNEKRYDAKLRERTESTAVSYLFFGPSCVFGHGFRDKGSLAFGHDVLTRVANAQQLIHVVAAAAASAAAAAALLSRTHDQGQLLLLRRRSSRPVGT